MPYEPDTGIGGSSGKFPLTRYSAIAAARSPDAGERRRAYETIVASYWKPAYKYIRIQWQRSNEDAKDLTQGFFALALEKAWFDQYDAGKGSFRGYLRTCIDGFVSNQQAAAGRLKRGGGVLTVPLDFENAEGELQQLPVAAEGGTEEFFYREWVRHLFTTAVEELREECEAAGKQLHFTFLERYDLEQTATSYGQLAQESGLLVTTVTNHLAWARRRFRRIVLDRIRAASGSEEEFQQEARALLGGIPR